MFSNKQLSPRLLKNRASAVVFLLAISGLLCAVQQVHSQEVSIAAKATKSLVSSAQPLWIDLAPAQKSFLQALEPQWYTLSPTERKSWVSLADRVPKMSAAQQNTATARVKEWAALTPEQRKLARANFRLAKELPTEERSAQWQQYQSLTPAQRTVLRSSGWTSNTAAQHAGSTTGLAKEASQPIKEIKAKAIKAPAATMAEAAKAEASKKQ